LAEQETERLAQVRTQEGRAFELVLAEQEVTASGRVVARLRFLDWVSRAGAVAACVVVLAVAVGVSWGAVGIGRAVATGAALRAGCVPLDKTTRQYPLVVSYIGRGRYSLANPNTGGVLMLDTRRAEDRDLIIASHAVELAGVLSQGARFESPSVVLPELVSHENV